MKNLALKPLQLGVALAAITLAPAANAQLLGGLDNNTVLAGGIGAALGGAIGSNLAPNGMGDEYTAIGGVVGGLAGAAYGNRQSQYAGNPYAGQFNPGFNGRNLVGTGIGAALGGAIGSNLAGSGVRQEGTALGAVLGGAAGYALSNRGQNQRHAGYGGQYGSQYGGILPAGPAYGPRYGAPNFAGANFAGSHFGSQMGGFSQVNSGYSLSGFSGATMVPSGQFTSELYAAPMTYVPQAPETQTVIVTRAPTQIKYVDRIQRVEVPKIVEKEVIKYVDRIQRVEVPKIIEKEVIKYVDRPVVVKPQPRPQPPTYNPCYKAPVQSPCGPSQSYSVTGHSGTGSMGTDYNTPSYSTYSAPQAQYAAPQAAYTSPVAGQADPYSLETYAQQHFSDDGLNYSAPRYGTVPPNAGSASSVSETHSMEYSQSWETPQSAYGVQTQTHPTQHGAAQAQYCYPDSPKRYDSLGREIKDSCSY